MISNNSVAKGSLPIASQEKTVQNNHMRLYTYLVSISELDFSTAESRKNGRRFFRQKDFNLNQIKKLTKMDYRTIKKYWKRLEDEGLIRYEGRRLVYASQEDWDKEFMQRKKKRMEQYSIMRPEQFRRIPPETAHKILYTYEITEQEFKIYLLLANLQEATFLKKQDKVYFTYVDLIDLLGLTNQKKNRQALLRDLCWLKELNLIDFTIETVKNNNFNQEINCFCLTQVNYYTTGGVLEKVVDEECSVITKEIKEEILARQPQIIASLSRN